MKSRTKHTTNKRGGELILEWVYTQESPPRPQTRLKAAVAGRDYLSLSLLVHAHFSSTLRIIASHPTFIQESFHLHNYSEKS